MIAMAQPPRHTARPAKAEQPEFDFEHDLPAGMETFAVHWLAARWKCSVQHVINLVECGEIPTAVDLRGKASSKAMIRVPRTSVVAFLNRRKDLAAVAAANPQPKPRSRGDEEEER